MRVVLKIVLTIPLLYIVAVPPYLRHKTGMVACGGLNIVVHDSLSYKFVSSGDIKELIYAGDFEFAGKPLRNISLKEIERKVTAIPELRSARVYFTIDGIINVEVEQRKPVMRLLTSSGKEYYIDDEGVATEKRGLYPPRVHVVRSSTDIGEELASGVHIDETGYSDRLTELFKLIAFIRGSDFWSAHIDQIDIVAGYEYELIPRSGGHKIRFGTISDVEQKFAALEAFYRNVMPVKGWEHYREVSVKYVGQIVCKMR